jgi:hypothetical protein
LSHLSDFQADYQPPFRVKSSPFFETIFIFITITITVHRHRNGSSEEILERKSDNLRLTKEDAEQAIIAKLQKEKDDEKKRVDAQFMRIWRMKRDEMHTKGVAARKAEKARIKQIKEMTKIIFLYLLNC